jgi:hypothetical protein
LIRHCLENAFKDLGIYLETIRSDEQFASINMDKFDIIIVDPWTWAGRGFPFIHSFPSFSSELTFRLETKTNVNWK